MDESAGTSLSRRRIFSKAVGVAAVGAAGGTVIRELTQSSSALAAGGTTVEPGAIAPAVVALTDGPTIAVDASLGNDFRVTLGGNRTMGSPSNPTDGQKVTFQLTQGSGGPYQVAWGSAYEFASSLPQPTLSTTAGLTDLLGFIYNANKGTWLMAGALTGFMTPSPGPTPTPTPSASATPTPSPSTGPGGSNQYRLFPSTNGPSAAVSYSGPFLSGVVFEVTAGGTWFEGYWWWVCDSGQPTAPQTFALWAAYNSGVGALVPAATAASGQLTAGQWNYVPLNTPVPLAPGVCYNACTGFSGGFPDTENQFGPGDQYSGGIVSGPITAFSDQTGSLPAPFYMPQGAFSVVGTDPTKNMPAVGSNSANFWMDLQVTTVAPTGTSYRFWPSFPTLPGAVDTDTNTYVLATEFKLTQACALDSIWFYSPPGATALPSRCAIWNVSTQTEVAGTDNSSPTWSGTAGSGWVSCSYTGVTLPTGDYKVAVFSGAGKEWFLVTLDYWGAGGPGTSGITCGPISGPGTTQTSPGQATYNQGSWAYPDSYGMASGGENFWVDVQVTPS